MQYNGTPPPHIVDLFPPDARALVSEIHKLHVDRENIAPLRQEVGLTGHGGHDGVLEAAQRRDAELLAEAARAGRDLTKVGTPNVDELNGKVARIRQFEQGYEMALTAASAELQAAIKSDAGEIRQRLGDELERAATDYERALDVMLDARRRMAELAGAFDFVDITLRTRGDRGITFVSRLDGDLDHGGAERVVFSQAISGLRNEVARARERAA